MKNFEDNFTTDIKLKENPLKEAKKVVLSPDGYAQGMMLAKVADALEVLRMEMIKR